MYYKMDKFIILALFPLFIISLKMSTVIYISSRAYSKFFETRINSFNSLELLHLNVLVERKSDMVDYFGGGGDSFAN